MPRVNQKLLRKLMDRTAFTEGELAGYWVGHTYCVSAPLMCFTWNAETAAGLVNILDILYANNPTLNEFIYHMLNNHPGIEVER